MTDHPGDHINLIESAQSPLGEAQEVDRELEISVRCVAIEAASRLWGIRPVDIDEFLLTAVDIENWINRP